ncbi:MAG: hypothetical protein AB1486_10315 [Planctomycetota bacterium]
MARSRFPGLPARLERLRGRVERWRQTRRRGVRMPEALWESAAELARAQGVNPIAQALRLDYYALRRRAETEAGCGEAHRGAGRVFVELERVAAPPGVECFIELTRPDGQMTIRLPSIVDLDVVGLATAFWDRQR